MEDNTPDNTIQQIREEAQILDSISRSLNNDRPLEALRMVNERQQELADRAEEISEPPEELPQDDTE